jgi:hypothetical protein
MPVAVTIGVGEKGIRMRSSPGKQQETELEFFIQTK